MNVTSILKGYGLYDDVIGIINDYAVGTKEDFRESYNHVLTELEVNDFDLYQINECEPSYKGTYQDLVDTLLFRFVEDQFSQYDPNGTYSSELISAPLCDWNISLYESILLSKLQRKLEQFVKVFPHIMETATMSLVDSRRLTDILKQPIYRDNYRTYHRTYGIQCFISRLRKRDTMCRLYFKLFSCGAHVELDRIANFPDLKIQFQLNQCHCELFNYRMEKAKKEKKKQKKLLLEQHKNFFVGWKAIPYSTGGADVTFTITRMTPKCIYYTKTMNGVESEPKRKLIKITEDENGFEGIQYFQENRHRVIKATYNMIY